LIYLHNLTRATYLESTVGNQFQVTISRAQNQIKCVFVHFLCSTTFYVLHKFVVGTDHC